MTDSAVLFLAEVQLHRGRPDRAVLLAALERILANSEPPIVFTRMEESGQKVPRDRPADAVVDGWEAAGCPVAFGVQARGGGTVAISTTDVAARGLGNLSLYWTLEPALDDGLVGLLVDLSRLLSSPLAVLSHTGARLERAGWRSREGAHMVAHRQVHGRGAYGLHLGLAGVAHRTVLGDELVAMFGEDRLAALPPELVHRRQGRWVLTPTDDPLAWTHDRWCPGEAAIVEALGPEHFFDPATGTLPKVVPELPPHAPYPLPHQAAGQRRVGRAQPVTRPTNPRQ